MKANASNVIRLINENVIFFDNIRFISLFLWNKIFKLKPKNLTEGKKRKNNLYHAVPPLYVQNKNGSRDCKSIPHLNLTFLHTTVCLLQGLPIDALVAQ